MSDTTKVTAVTNEVYGYLTEMCGASGIDIADLIQQLAAKQQLIDIRRGMILSQSVGMGQ